MWEFKDIKNRVFLRGLFVYLNDKVIDCFKLHDVISPTWLSDYSFARLVNWLFSFFVHHFEEEKGNIV